MGARSKDWRHCLQCSRPFHPYIEDVKRSMGLFCSKRCFQLSPRRYRGASRPAEPLSVRFWKHIEKTEGCWLWTGTRSSYGYGVIGCVKERGGRTLRTHRVSWELHFGPIPDGLYVCHRCDNPPCANPAHLFLGTNSDNSNDKVVKGRTPKGDKNGAYTHPESRPFGDRNGSRRHPEARPRGSAYRSAKLTEATARAILDSFASGDTKAALARRYGVSETLIYNVVTGRNWRHATVGQEHAMPPVPL